MSKTKQKKEEKPTTIEKVAEDTGELIGKGIRKTWNVAKSFGKGLVDAVDKTEDRKDTSSSACPHCGASLPPKSNFCPNCGKKPQSP